MPLFPLPLCSAQRRLHLLKKLLSAAVMFVILAAGSCGDGYVGKRINNGASGTDCQLAQSLGPCVIRVTSKGSEKVRFEIKVPAKQKTEFLFTRRLPLTDRDVFGGFIPEAEEASGGQFTLFAPSDQGEEVQKGTTDSEGNKIYLIDVAHERLKRSEGSLTFYFMPTFRTGGPEDEKAYVYEETLIDFIYKVVVTITTGNTAPVLSEIADKSLLFGSLAVTQVAAADLDGDELSYALSGDDAGKFTISDAGVITLASAQPAGAYNLSVTANDGSKDSPTKSFVVTIVTSGPPVIADVGQITIAENSTAVATISTTVTEGRTATFDLSGTDADKFSISTGALAFIAAPNFEAPTDVGADNTYAVTVVLTDSAGLTDSEEVTVSVTNVNEPPLWDLGDIDVYSGNAAEGVRTVATYSATDVDAGDAVTYTLSGDDAAKFTISSTGVLSFLIVTDFENPTDNDQDNKYEVTITATDEGDLTDILDLTVVVENVASEMSITSAAFKDTGSTFFNLPLSYTCYGALKTGATVGGISPLLTWSNAPDGTTHYALTMHSVAADGGQVPHFTLFNIASTVTTLPADDFSAATAAAGDMTATAINAAGGSAYAAPCATGGGTESFYNITVYALNAALSLTATATQAEVEAAVGDALLGSFTLKTRRVSYDAASISANEHVPTAIAATCDAKTAHFNEYSTMHSSITCPAGTNEMIVSSKIDSGLKTALTDQQLFTGKNAWHGRLPLPSASVTSLRIEPAYLSGVNNNFECSGVDIIGTTVDGQPILPYFFENSGGIQPPSFLCGPTDGSVYTSFDAVLIGEVDQCYGHSPNGEGYHLHGAPICLMDVHDPSKPLAYMSDGIPLYFGQAGGVFSGDATTRGIFFLTPTNYGAGQYDHLDYRPSDVINATKPLNACNAYDINGDGATSGYAYYTSKEAPYTAGCYQGTVLPARTAASGATVLATTRTGFTGQTLGSDAVARISTNMEVAIASNVYSTVAGKTYNVTEFATRVGGSTPAFLTAGATAQVLWRILEVGDASYNPATTCFEFRYREDKTNTTSDEVQTHCAVTKVADATLSFTPYGS